MKKERYDKKIESIFSEMDNLKLQLEKFRQIGDDLRKIERIVTKSISSIEELYRESINRIEIIMKEKEES